jgi:hypothetical protein
MSIDRLIPTSGTGVTGTAFADAIQDEVTGLWGNSVIPLTDVAGTGDAITATVSPALTDGLAAGMNFWLVATADNTGPATIAIGAEDPVDLVDDDGLALGAALVKDGRRYLLSFDGTAMRVLGTSGQKRIADYQTFTADGTWNKPAGTPDDAIVIVEVIGGGAGGNGSYGGGGGGEYKRTVFRAGDISSSETVSVATAVAVGTAGNNSSFGSWLTAYGGGTGSYAGGAGGGPFGKGGNASSTSGGGAGVSAGNGGGGAVKVTATTTQGSTTAGWDGYYGGGGGGGGGTAGSDSSAYGRAGGRSVYGGGGGAGNGQNGQGTAGLSTYAGNGGAVSQDGIAPGGGGGAGGGGARGEVRVRTIG